MTATICSVRTDVLELHYVDAGPRDGPVAMLLHGWPDDAHTWDAVAQHLHAAGWRTIAPFMRGFGPSRFLHDATPRSAQLTALASDALALADALALPRFAVVGHDWGARTAFVLAAQAPHRLTHCAALSVGYGPTGADAPLPLQQAQQFWYQWLLALPLGEAKLRSNRNAFCHHLWRTWSPAWQFAPEAFARTTTAFDNPDWLAVTLHGYRHRWGLAEGDARYAVLEQHQATIPPIDVPVLVLHGADDRCIVPESSKNTAAYACAPYRREVLPGVGHFPQREAPDSVAQHLLAWLTAVHPQRNQ